MSKKTFRYLFIIAAAIVAAIALGSSFRSEKTDETRRKPLNLNKTLTNEMSDTSVLDMYYYVDDSALPLHKGDRVMMGEFSWYVHDTVFDYNNNNLIYTLVR